MGWGMVSRLPIMRGLVQGAFVATARVRPSPYSTLYDEEPLLLPANISSSQFVE